MVTSAVGAWCNMMVRNMVREYWVQVSTYKNVSDMCISRRVNLKKKKNDLKDTTGV